MKNIFLIFGYGIPKNIFEDENYNTYLKLVFNRIYDTVEKNKTNPIIICSGGKTDLFKPYNRTEAGETIKFLKNLSNKKSLIKSTRNWIFQPETKSLSTLENFLNSEKILKDKKIQKANITIFCEKTREKRIKKLAEKILNQNHKIKIIAIDFDTSDNRYLDSKFILKKEKTELKHALWALKSKKNLEQHHKLFEEKFKYLRSSQGKNLKKWWAEKIKKLQ